MTTHTALVILLVAAFATCGLIPQFRVGSTHLANEDPIAQRVREAMDFSFDPCDDFYQFSCGAWIKNTTLPGDQSRFVKSFDTVTKKNQQILAEVIKNPEKLDPKLRDFWNSCINVEAIDKIDVKKSLSFFMDFIDEEVEKKWDRESTFAFIGILHSLRMNSLFSIGMEIDPKNPERYLLQLSQGGLTLPDRSLYLNDDKEGKDLLVQYEQHIVNMLKLQGLSATKAAKSATEVIQLEKALAKISISNADLRDPFKTYNKIDQSQLRELFPSANWLGYFVSAGMTGVDIVNVKVPTFFKQLSDLFKKDGFITPSMMASYLRWVVLHEVADYLPKSFRDENFEFFGKVIDGSKSQPDRTKLF